MDKEETKQERIDRKGPGKNMVFIPNKVKSTQENLLEFWKYIKKTMTEEKKDVAIVFLHKDTVQELIDQYTELLN